MYSMKSFVRPYGFVADTCGGATLREGWAGGGGARAYLKRLIDRHALGVAVHCGRRGEDNVLAVVLGHHVE